ncbi:MAG: F0F1 ATP synthase subunit delta [Acidobacteria bacterium]|nr:F0F1 ATP synthase subunit delta [Acidobacteriota bacterium]
MGSASRQALVAAERTLAATAGVTLAAGEQLLSAGRAIEGSAQLRGLLADPSLENAEKAGLISTIFGAIDATASALLLAIATTRWSDADELLDGIEQIGIRAIAHSAGPGAAIESELFEFSRAVSSNSDLELALADKLGDPAAKAALVDRLLTTKASPSTTAIVRHLVQSPRGRRIGALLSGAASIVADEAGRLVATVTTAVPLSAAQQKRLTGALAAQYGREPRLNIVIDPTVIGGLRVQLGDEVVDGTVASRLSDLRLQLAG